MEPRIDRVEANNETDKSISAEEAEINSNNLEKKMNSQLAVFRFMVPTVFQGYLADDPYVTTNPAEGDLFFRWHIKYSSLFGDYYTELMASDDEAGKESRDRILAGKPTAEDCLKLKQYLEDPANIGIDRDGNKIGGMFFADETEIADLGEEYKLRQN
jgi:hypothetical protein